MIKDFYLRLIILFALSINVIITSAGADEVSQNVVNNSQKNSAKLIEKIKEQFRNINSKIFEFNRIERSICGESTEGGEFIGYYDYDSKQLKKLVLQLYNETNKSIMEFYFQDEKLFFIFEEHINYKESISAKSAPKIAKSEQNRYYINNFKIISWLDNKRKKVNDQDGSYKTKIEEIKNIIKKYQYKYEHPCDCVTEECIEGEV